MKRALCTAVLTTGLLTSLSPTAQESDQGPIYPANIDPEEPSGWLQIELAVLVDAKASTLAAENWPPFPEVRYPGNYRYLIDTNLEKAERERWFMAESSQNDRGAITVKLPDPLTIIAEAQRTAEAEARALEQAQSAASQDANGEDSDNSEAPNQATQPVPLELIDAPEQPTTAGAEWLTDFEAPDTEQIAEPETDIAVPTDPALLEPTPLPQGFRIDSPEMLATGLRSLRRDTGDEVALSVAWIQPPGAAALPIVLDGSGDTLDWPPLQGFIDLRRGNPVRLGVNFWWNTDAGYMPDSFQMAAPPRAPKRVSIIDGDSGTALTEQQAETRSEQLAAIAEQQARGETPTPFVDPATGYLIDGSQQKDRQRMTLGARDEASAWPWRHVIHVADTRVLPEGSVRYFDHPVIKILATYRELTWAEVYAEGKRQQDAALYEQELAEERAQ